MIELLVDKLTRLFFAFRHRRTFRYIGAKTMMVSPFRLDGPEGIAIGSGTFVQRGGWLYCRGINGQVAALTIGHDCVFGYNNHITAVREVVIGDEVLTANNVFISDNVHAFEDIDTPIMHQPVLFKRAVSIGSGSWIGENACIIGASVGRNCVIGANAVVTHDVPDFSVAAGVPAVVIRRYDVETRQWVGRSRA